MALQRRWELQPEAPSFRYDYLTEYVERFAYISDEVTKLCENCKQGNTDLYEFKKTARIMSSNIRMILLGDNSGNFFSKCVKDPRLHPFFVPRSADSPPDKIFSETPEMTITYMLEGEDRERKETTPKHQHTTVVGPLYGLEKIDTNRYRLGKLQNLSKQPVKHSYWLNTKVLQVGKTILTAEQLLRVLANKEGVHIDEPVGRAVALVDKEQYNKDLMNAYQKSNLLLFGGLSYLHIFTLMVGVYLNNMMKRTLRHLPQSLRRQSIKKASEHILRTPESLPVVTMQLQAQLPPVGIIMEEKNEADNNSGEHFRALPKTEETVFRIPKIKK